MVVFGQELPDRAASAALQLFSLVVAAIGFASFALVLALVEQVVLQVLDTNVRQGGMVYEDGHILVLSLAENQRDQEVIFKILSQVSRRSSQRSKQLATHGHCLRALSKSRDVPTTIFRPRARRCASRIATKRRKDAVPSCSASVRSCKWSRSFAASFPKSAALARALYSDRGCRSSPTTSVRSPPRRRLRQS